MRQPQKRASERFCRELRGDFCERLRGKSRCREERVHCEADEPKPPPLHRCRCTNRHVSAFGGKYGEYMEYKLVIHLGCVGDDVDGRGVDVEPSEGDEKG